MPNTFNKEKIIYYLLAAYQLHATLIKFNSSYAKIADSITEDLFKKLGFKKSLWDEIIDFIQLEKPEWHMLEVFDTSQNDLFEAFLHENLQIEKTIRFKNSFSATDDIRLSKGEVYLQSIEHREYINHETRHSIRESYKNPEFLKHHGEETKTVGYSGTHITFAKFKEIPLVLQRTLASESGPMSITYITQNDTNLIQEEFNKKVKYKSRFQGWVCKCNEKDGQPTISYIEEPCIELRYKKNFIDYSLFTENAQNLLKQEIPTFIKSQDKLSELGHGSRRDFIIEGPSGSGKSTLVKAIITSMPENYTTVVMKDNLHLLPNFHEHPYLFPLLIIIEDLELILNLPPHEDLNKIKTLINFLDGLNSSDKIITIITTSNAELVEKFLNQRSCRTDRLVKLKNNNIVEREKQLSHLLKGLYLPTDLTTYLLAEQIKDCTIAQLKEFVKRSILYTQDNSNEIKTKLSKNAIQRAIEELNIKKENQSKQWAFNELRVFNEGTDINAI